MNLVTSELDLPIFLRSRTRFRNDGTINKYIGKHRKLYAPFCYTRQSAENVMLKKYQEIMGLDKKYQPQCATKRLLSTKRDLISVKPWHLAPNRYGVPQKPFAGMCGVGGAHWPKLHKHTSLLKKGYTKPKWKFYEKPGVMDCLTTACHNHKGIFLNNARDYRATSRSMVNHPGFCYRNPNEPGATTYNSQLHEITYNIHKIKTKLPNPHIFLRSSVVPAKPNSIHQRNISFKPAPGRYENRFPKVCACSSKLMYSPDIQIEIEKQKRLKFRRQPYVKINWRRYCTPKWGHVEGHGHRWIFMNPTPKRQKINLNISKAVKKAEKQYQLYPDARYINMINDPSRTLLSLRSEPLISLPIKFKYNCIAKRIVRRQLRNNKKIAFLSGQVRFKDVERPPQPTARELAERKQKLPVERQLRSQPISRVPLSEVKSKLNETPTHMLLAYEITLRKRMFKFLPLPGPRILATKSVIAAKEAPFYSKPLNPRFFF